jgi:hypothetical protein
MLSFYGVDTQDRAIAIEMGLPYFFDVEDGFFSAGPMLQGEKWFNLYLNPLGFAWVERKIETAALCSTLRKMEYAMLGIHVSDDNKHAVVFTGVKGDKFEFLNNTWERTDEPGTLLFTENALVDRVDPTVTVGYLVKTDRKSVCKNELLKRSEGILWNLVEEKSVPELHASMNLLFRPILLDGITMLELLGQTVLRDQLRTVQGQYMQAQKENKPLRLSQYLDLNLLEEAARGYAALIHEQAAETLPLR